MKETLRAILYLFLGCALTYGLGAAFVVLTSGHVRDASYLPPELYLAHLAVGLMMGASIVVFCVGTLVLIGRRVGRAVSNSKKGSL